MMIIKKLLSKYILNTELIFDVIKITKKRSYIHSKEVDNVVETAKRYLKDAKYYQEMQKFETGLTAVAYCEGLLDALRLLEIAEFQ